MGKVDGKAHEDEERQDLKGKPCDEDIVTSDDAFIPMTRRRGKPTARCLQEQRSDIARDKDARIRQSLDPRVGRAERHDDTRKRQIKPRRQERRRNRQTAYLDKKGILSRKERVLSAPRNPWS